jgi:hypothetical protein
MVLISIVLIVKSFYRLLVKKGLQPNSLGVLCGSVVFFLSSETLFIM